MKIENLPLVDGFLETAPKKDERNGKFDELLTDFIAGVNSDLNEADKAQKALADGNAEDMVQIMSTIEKADVSLRFATEVRNKALEAYQEVMRMQV